MWSMYKMSLQFNEEFFTTKEMANYKDFPHFQKRAKWITSFVEPSKKIYVLGCGFGYVIKYLLQLGYTNIKGVELSDYAYQKATELNLDSYIIHDCIAKVDYSDADLIISWNVLDCITPALAQEIANTLNKSVGVQIHIICTIDDIGAQQYLEQKFYIQSIEYWQILFPNAVLVKYHSGKIYGTSTLLKIPLSWDKVSE